MGKTSVLVDYIWMLMLLCNNAAPATKTEVRPDCVGNILVKCQSINGVIFSLFLL